MLGAWNMELFFYMFKLIMAKHYPNSVKTREIYRYNRMNNCLIDVCNTWLFSHCWLMFAPYKYSSVVGWCLKHIIIESWLVDIWNIWLQSHGWLVFGTYNYSFMDGVVYVAGVLFAFLVLTIMNYFLFPSWSTGYLILEYMIPGFGDLVALHYKAFGVMSRTYGCDNLWLRPYRYNIVYWA